MSENINRRAFAINAAALTALSATSAAAQARLDVAAIVNAAATALSEQYVDPDVAVRLADHLRARLGAGAYETSSRSELAQRLTADLRALTNDLHLEVVYQPPTPSDEDPEAITEDYEHPRTTGWGVQTAARLPGNIGLLRVTHFPSPPVPRVAPRYAAAMELLQDTSALILDLTINHGGGEDTSGFFLSYFLDGDLEFGRMVWRSGEVEVIRSVPDAPGPHYGEVRPLYVCVSGNTFSAGEAIAAQLKQRGRAVLVGERTRGGAHAGNFVDLPDHFRIFIVMGRGDGPDWEGVGVPPDVEAPARQAVAVAHRLALQMLLSHETNPLKLQILRNVTARSIENLSSFPGMGPLRPPR